MLTPPRSSDPDARKARCEGVSRRDLEEFSRLMGSDSGLFTVKNIGIEVSTG
jgi:hypothetical protein